MENPWIEINNKVENLPKKETNVKIRLIINLREENYLFVPMPDTTFSTNFLLKNCSHYRHLSTEEIKQLQ